MPDGATRLVSLHDPDARPIRKGRIDRHVEFGYKAQVTDNDDGIVLDYAVEGGAAPDGPQLVPAIKRVTRRTGRVPRAVTADRGYGQAAVERDLHELGVRTVAIPRQATTSPARKTIEHSRGFRKLVKVADRVRRPDQLPQARLRLEPDPPGRQERRRHLVRARGTRPQPGQDQRPGRITPAQTPGPAVAPPPELSPPTFSGRSS
jgi:IS5 family transposase